MTQLLTALIDLIRTFIKRTDMLDERLDDVEAEMATLSEVIAKLQEDAGQVKAAVDSILAKVIELERIVADLQQNGATPENIAALEKVHADLDAIEASVTPVPPVEPVSAGVGHNSTFGGKKTNK